MRNTGFPPIVGGQPKVLILGSMPGTASLQAQQYYAHPRNVFWRIICHLLNGAKSEINASSDYAARRELLLSHGVALWDVMYSCERRGSLDANITEQSIQANDFKAFYSAHPSLRAVFFNGTKAQQSYQRYVYPRLNSAPAALPTHRLPSTSPAHAALSFEQKLVEWQRIDNYLGSSA